MTEETKLNSKTEEGASELEALRDIWQGLSAEQRWEAFKNLDREEAIDFFLSMGASDHYILLESMKPSERKSWLRLLAADDAADLIQKFPTESQASLLELLDLGSRKEVEALLAYSEDQAGGLMNPRFIRLRPDVTVDVAIRYLRLEARDKIEVYQYAYVLDSQQHLLGVVSVRLLFLSPADELVSSIMIKDVISVPEDMHQEEVSRRLKNSGLVAVPVVDAENRMKGVVTVDDVIDVVQEEATEDIQKLGGSAALDEPYPQMSLFQMVKKRAGWLAILFLGEMFTATAMGYFEKEIERAVVLALFIPLIISSGGNSGSQATSLIIRSLALREINLRDWWRVLLREIGSGLALGIILGSIGLMRILLWPSRNQLYGEHYVLVAATVACSLIGVVLWGSVAGSMLPFVLRRLGFDPATASAPFVATLVDVTGLIIYFTVASIILHGTLL